MMNMIMTGNLNLMCVLVIFTQPIALVAMQKKEEKRNRKEDMGREEKTIDVMK